MLSVMKSQRGSMMEINSRSESMAPGIVPARSSMATLGTMPPALDASALRQWLVGFVLFDLLSMLTQTRKTITDPQVALNKSG